MGKVDFHTHSHAAIVSTWWWYHSWATSFRNSRVLNTLSLSWSGPPYMLTLNITMKLVNHFSKSPNLAEPLYLFMDEWSAHHIFVPSGIFNYTDMCSCINWRSHSCIWLWWCSTASITPGVLYCGCTAAGTEYPWCWLLFQSECSHWPFPPLFR